MLKVLHQQLLRPSARPGRAGWCARLARQDAAAAPTSFMGIAAAARALGRCRCVTGAAACRGAARTACRRPAGRNWRGPGARWPRDIISSARTRRLLVAGGSKPGVSAATPGAQCRGVRGWLAHGAAGLCLLLLLALWICCVPPRRELNRETSLCKRSETQLHRKICTGQAVCVSCARGEQAHDAAMLATAMLCCRALLSTQLGLAAAGSSAALLCNSSHACIMHAMHACSLQSPLSGSTCTCMHAHAAFFLRAGSERGWMHSPAQGCGADQAAALRACISVAVLSQQLHTGQQL